MKNSKLFKYITNIVLILSISSIAFLGCTLAAGGSGDGDKNNDPPPTPTITGTLIYAEINQQKANTAKTVTPTGTLVSNTTQTVKYTINPALPTGATIDETTGEIDLPATVMNTIKTATYTITATGTGTYIGTITAEFKLHLAASPIDGTLSYPDTLGHEFGTAGTISPSWQSVTAAGQTVTYSIAGAPAGITINATSGDISITATARVQSQATYTVTVVGTGNYGGTLTGTVKIAVITIDNPLGTAYNGTKSTDTGGAILGPFIKEPITGATGALFADSEVINVTGLTAGTTYTYTLGSASGTKTADGTGKITIQRSDIRATNAAFNANMTLTGGGIKTADQNIATYKADIYTWKDLQAMRQNLAGTYTLMNDVTIPNAGSDELPTAGFEPIGKTTSGTTRFTGTLTGSGTTAKKIINLYINRASLDTGTGLFGAIEGASTSTVVVQKITLEDPSIVGKYYVGGIAGVFYQGKMSEVGVSASGSATHTVKIQADAQRTTTDNAVGGAHIPASPYMSPVGGIVGAAFGGSTAGNNVQILKTYNSGVTVIGKYQYTGGLVGILVNGRVVGYSTATVQLAGAGNMYKSGGLVGAGRYQVEIVGYSTGNIEKTGTATSIYNTGGLVGYLDHASAGHGRVIGYYTGEIKGGLFSVVGGLIGEVYKPKAFATSSDDGLIVRGYFQGKILNAGLSSGGIIGEISHDSGATHMQVYNRGLITLGITSAPYNAGMIVGRSARTLYATNAGVVLTGMYSPQAKAGEGKYIANGRELHAGTTPKISDVVAPGGTATGYSATNASDTGTSGTNVGALTTAAFYNAVMASYAAGTSEGKWYKAIAKWPAIHLGTDMPTGHTGTSTQGPLINP